MTAMDEALTSIGNEHHPLDVYLGIVLGHEVRVLVDSGAAGSFIHAQLAQKLTERTSIGLFIYGKNS